MKTTFNQSDRRYRGTVRASGEPVLRSTWRLLAIAVLTSCTIAGSPRMRDASSHHHLATVPPEALDHQDPGADTSKNPIISREVAAYRHGPPEMSWRGGSYDALAAIGYALAIATVR